MVFPIGASTETPLPLVKTPTKKYGPEELRFENSTLFPLNIAASAGA